MSFTLALRVFHFCLLVLLSLFFFFKQKTAYEMRISDWSSRVLFRSADCRIPPNFAERLAPRRGRFSLRRSQVVAPLEQLQGVQIGRASCRERVCQYV